MYTIAPNIYSTSSIFTDAYGVVTKPTLVQVQSKDTGPGVSSVQSRGTHIISANTGVKSQVDILDNIFENQTSYVIPGSNSSTTPLTKVALYASNTLIVGTEKSVLPEIVFFDISNGQVIHTIETGYGINDMILLDNLLIVAGPRDPEIEIFDVGTSVGNGSNTDNGIFGQKVGEYDLLGGSGNAKVLSLFGDFLYVARTKGGNEFVILDMERVISATPTAQAISFKEITNKKIGWSVDSLLNFEQYILLFTADEYKEFQLYKISDIDQQLSLQSVVDLPARVTGSMCFKNTVWATLRDPEGVGTNTNYSDVPALALIVF
jgi:hypothetical protein